MTTFSRNHDLLLNVQKLKNSDDIVLFGMYAQVYIIDSKHADTVNVLFSNTIREIDYTCKITADIPISWSMHTLLIFT